MKKRSVKYFERKRLYKFMGYMSLFNPKRKAKADFREKPFNFFNTDTWVLPEPKEPTYVFSQKTMEVFALAAQRRINKPILNLDMKLANIPPPAAFTPHIISEMQNLCNLSHILPVTTIVRNEFDMLEHKPIPITVSLPPDIEYWRPKNFQLYTCKDRHPVTFDPLDEE